MSSSIQYKLTDERILEIQPNTPENIETVRKRLVLARMHVRETGLFIPIQKINDAKRLING